jgi:DNA-binding IclR family transcriptional regulator
LNKVHSIKSLNKAFDILDAFLKSSGDLSLAEIARITGLNKPTATRIVSNLVTRGYLKQREKRGKYSLGMIYLTFSGVIKRDIKLRDIAGPYLAQLSDQLNESIIIAYGNGYEGIFTETIHGHFQKNQVLKVIPDEGSNLPLHCTCLGKIFLAEMPDEDLARYIQLHPLQRYTPNSILDLSILKQQLGVIKSEGVSYDYEEYTPGVRGVGAGIRNHDGVIVGGIAILAPSTRLTPRKMPDIAVIIKKSADQISAELGYKISCS